MQFSVLYGQQLDVELGSADRTNLFTTVRRQKAINDAMHNFERITSCTPVYGQIPIVDGTAEYDLITAFPNYLSLQDRREPALKRVTGAGTVSWIQGDTLPRRDPTWLDREDPGWQADPKGVPSSWYLRSDTGHLYVGLDPAPNPAANGETWTLFVPFLANSNDMVNDTDVPFTITVGATTNTVLDVAPFHQALVHYAAGLLEPLRKNYSGSQRQMGLYAGYVAQFETKKRKDGPNQVTFRRNYYRDAAKPSRPVDPHRFP